MPNYRRPSVPGGMLFFTVVAHRRRPILTAALARDLLHRSFEKVREKWPFEVRAIVLLPDHLHTLWVLPEGDADYSTRLGLLKKRFTDLYLAAGGREGDSTPSRVRHRVRGIWQKRFHDHAIRDYADYKLHLDYIHSNPVKHGLVAMPKDWPWSSFHRFVKAGEYDEDWCGHVELPGGADVEPDQW